MICFGYISFARRSFSDADLHELATKAAANNEKMGISGILCMSDNRFMQFLEGDEPHVSKLYDRISRDVRHGNCTPLYRSSISTRMFDGWGMALKDPEKLAPTLLPEFKRLMSLELTPDINSPDHQRYVGKLISGFRDI